MKESILFKSVNLMLPEGERKGDLLIEKGKIKAIGPSLPDHAETIISEAQLTLIPGVIDPHVHFREPGGEHKETIQSGSKACAAGGVTSFFEMPNTNPPTTTAETVYEKKKIAENDSLVNYNFFIGATPDNLDELNSVENVPGIKIYAGCSTGSLLVDQTKDLERIFANGHRLIAVHSEDNVIIEENRKRFQGNSDPSVHSKIRSSDAAISSTKRLVGIAEKTQRRLHICHMSTEEEVCFFESHKPDYITCEVSPQHLLLNEPEIYEKLGTFAQMNPPLRSSQHSQVLWRGLKSGLISCIATDHAPHAVSEKALPFGQAPSGLPGVETSLTLLLNEVNKGRCTLADVVKWMCMGPAKTFAVKNKGELRQGFDGDVVLVNMQGKKVISNRDVVSKAGWTAFDGREVQGLPLATFVNGQMVFREGDFFTEIKGKEVLFN